MYQDGVLLNWHCSGWQGPSCQLIAHQQEWDNLTTDHVVKKGSRGASKSASKQWGASRNLPTGQIAVGKFEKKQQLEVLASFFGPKLLCYWKHLLNWSSPQKSLLLTTTRIATILFNFRHFLAQPPKWHLHPFVNWTFKVSQSPMYIVHMHLIILPSIVSWALVVETFLFWPRISICGVFHLAVLGVDLWCRSLVFVWIDLDFTELVYLGNKNH